MSAGVDVVQLREGDLAAGALASLVRGALELARGTATRVVVNDRLDVALACGADGVHLAGRSVPVGAARAVAPGGFLIGRSVHSVEEALAEGQGADYLIAGTVWRSASKPGLTRWLGVGGLRAIARAVRIPVLAVGGVTVDRVGEVRGAGAVGVAAIGAFLDEATPDLACRAMDLAGRCRNLRDAFDRGSSGS